MINYIQVTIDGLSTIGQDTCINKISILKRFILSSGVIDTELDLAKIE